MAIIVQKFGGTSLADPACIARCAARAIAAHRAGHQVVVVVSAMGRGTDELVELARQITDRPCRREMARLLATGEQVSSALMTMALQEQGVDAVGFSGPSLGIVTDPVHHRARIRSIDVQRMRAELDRGRIVAAAGFQGITADGDITTLGRGGSDTSAVAIAAALDVAGTGGLCEIYTDVDGVYTADPRIVPRARKLDRITADEMLELASLGAGVLHPRSVVLGRRHGVPIRVRASNLDDARDLNAGTIIVNQTNDLESAPVVGCALTGDLGRITVRDLPNRPGTDAALFRRVADADLLVDDIMQLQDGATVDVSFTVEAADLADVRVAVQSALDALGIDTEVSVEVGLAKVSVVGMGMRSHAGVAATMFEALGGAGINIVNITTSEIKISCLVAKEQSQRALQIVHDAFGLGGTGAVVEPKPGRTAAPAGEGRRDGSATGGAEDRGGTVSRH